MSFISIKPLPFQYRVHFNGAGYYYTSEQGEQLSKAYSTIGRLHRYGKVIIWE